MKDNKVKFLLRSEKYDKNKNYFYYKNHIINKKEGIGKDPDVKFEIIDNKLVFRDID